MEEETLRVGNEWLPTEADVSQIRVRDNKNLNIYYSPSSFSTEPEPLLLSNTQALEGIKVIILGRNEVALADTGASANFMSLSAAKQRGLEVSRYLANQAPSFMIGTGKSIESIGTVAATLSFEREPKKTRSLNFEILRQSVVEIILGNPFIRLTKCLALHRKSLVSMAIVDHYLQRRLVGFCGNPRSRIPGYLNSIACSGVVDSASHPNLLSLEYVRANGWVDHMEQAPEPLQEFCFIDGTSVRNEGRLYLHWRFQQGWKPSRTARGSKLLNACGFVRRGRSCSSEEELSKLRRLQREFDGCKGSKYSVVMIFDVLKGSPFDVLLGQSFLFRTGVFRQESLMEHTVSTPGLNHVFFKTRAKKVVATTQANQINLRHEYLQSCIQADERISQIVDPEDRERERAAEAERQRQWLAAHPGSMSLASGI